MDPSEDHNLGSKILKVVLNTIIKSEEGFYGSLGINRLMVDLLNLESVNVYREYDIGKYGRLDIFVELKNQLAVLIEIKLFSNEGDSQTERYDDYASQLKGKYKDIICAYITPYGSPCKAKNFTCVAFSDLLQVFKSNQFESIMNEKNRYLWQNFINWMEELTPMDSDIRALCRNIYRQYKAELDMIINNIPSASAFYCDVADYINTNFSDKLLAHSGSYWVTVSPLTWMGEKELKESKNYTKPRIEYNAYNENQTMYLVMPQSGKIYDRVKAKSKEILGQGKSFEPFKNWRNFYLSLHPEEPFIPENITNWDEVVKETADRLNEEMSRIIDILPADYLLK